MNKKNKHTHIGFRDSSTGRFITKDQARRNPKGTQKEQIPKPGRGDTGRSNSSKNKK